MTLITMTLKNKQGDVFTAQYVLMVCPACDGKGSWIETNSRDDEIKQDCEYCGTKRFVLVDPLKLNVVPKVEGEKTK